MKNKKWLLILIILIPSLFWVILETSTINSYKLHYYGPKKALAENDTLYHTVSDSSFLISSKNTNTPAPFKVDTAKYPVYAIMFIKNSYSNDSYRLAGLWEFLNYKKEKVEHIPFFLVTETTNHIPEIQTNLEKMSSNKNLIFLSLEQPQFDSLNYLYFKEKPIHIDYSFIALIDSKRHIRGYYDARYAAEIKRLGDEYKHLRLKDEKQKLTRSNEIKGN